MSLYRKLSVRLGRGPATTAIIVGRAALIVLIVILSDKGFTSFTYLQLSK